MLHTAGLAHAGGDLSIRDVSPLVHVNVDATYLRDGGGGQLRRGCRGACFYPRSMHVSVLASDGG